MPTQFVAWGQRITRAGTPQPPANSLPLINQAFALGYDAIELDIRITKDQRLVLMHDPTIDKATGSTGRVRSYNCDELTQMRLLDPWGGDPCHIPSLEQALREVARRGAVMCDLRTIDGPTLDALEGDLHASGHPAEELIFIPYTVDEAAMLKDRFPGSVVLIKPPSTANEQNDTSAGLGPDFVDRAQGFDGILLPIAQRPEAVRLFRDLTDKLSLKLGVYIQHQGGSALAELARMGVDYITTVSHGQFAEARRVMR